MMVCADTSFIVKLLTREPGSDLAVAWYRRLGRPGLPFTLVHRLEVESALGQKAFQARNKGVPRQVLTRDSKAVRDRLAKWLRMTLLVETEIQWNDCFLDTLKFLPVQSDRVGCRTMDMVHVGIARQMGADLFLTCDARQARAAKAVGMKVAWVGIGKGG